VWNISYSKFIPIFPNINFSFWRNFLNSLMLLSTFASLYQVYNKSIVPTHHLMGTHWVMQSSLQLFWININIKRHINSKFRSWKICCKSYTSGQNFNCQHCQLFAGPHW
jgi:hypothetical protein